MTEEKRTYPRAELRWLVSVITSQGTIRGEIKNISLNGAHICGDKALCPNEIILLTVKGPSGSMQFIAQVVWSNLCSCDDVKRSSGIGVKFIWSHPNTKPECMIWRKAS